MLPWTRLTVERRADRRAPLDCARERTRRRRWRRTRQARWRCCAGCPLRTPLPRARATPPHRRSPGSPGTRPRPARSQPARCGTARRPAHSPAQAIRKPDSSHPRNHSASVHAAAAMASRVPRTLGREARAHPPRRRRKQREIGTEASGADRREPRWHFAESRQRDVDPRHARTEQADSECETQRQRPPRTRCVLPQREQAGKRQ